MQKENPKLKTSGKEHFWMQRMKFEGIMPALQSPSPASLDESFNRFLEDKPVSKGDVETIIAQAVYEDRMALMNNFPEVVFADMEDSDLILGSVTMLSGMHLSLRCGDATQDLDRRIKSLSKGRIRYMKIATQRDVGEELDGRQLMTHSFGLAAVECGDRDERFIVDTTLRQGFQKFEGNKTFVAKTLEGRCPGFVDRVLEKGYSKLGDDEVKALGEAFGLTDKPCEFTFADLVKYSIADYRHAKLPLDFEKYTPRLAEKRYGQVSWKKT